VRTNIPIRTIVHEDLQDSPEDSQASQGTVKLNSVALVREQTMPTERPPLVGEVVPTFGQEGVAWSGQRIPTVANLGFLDRSRYLFFQLAPQLSSRG
jgi:hypothetical protein